MVSYLGEHPEVSNVLLTGGDPLIMAADVLRRYVEPLLAVDTVDTVRISTKALSYWPHRFVTDPDADAMLRLFEQVTGAGRQLAVMVHVSHPRELDPPIVATALRRVRSTGAVLRFQAPVIRGINDDAVIWSTMWRRLTALGVVPYYMFVERDTGPHDFFAVPLERAYTIFRDAYSTVSGLARTARGPVLSTTSGKVCVDGVATIAGERVFVLRYLQARDPGLVGRPFFAQFDSAATWLSDLKPAFGAAELGPQPT
jgi:L-lysine 2,3-aminomutase